MMKFIVEYEEVETIRKGRFRIVVESENESALLRTLLNAPAVLLSSFIGKKEKVTEILGGHETGVRNAKIIGEAK